MKFKITAIFILIILLTLFWNIKGCFEPKQNKLSEPTVKLYLSKVDQVEKMKLEEYVVGTLAAEMPASFELEALKAQAVCARTYALRKLLMSPQYPHQADLSDDIYSCQAYTSQYNNWNPDLVNKIHQAVNETRGVIMLYDHKPIDALYHSTCGGQTESAINGWGKDIPYLQSVKCKYCQESTHYTNVSRETLVNLHQKLGFSKHYNIKILQRTSSGRVKKIQINSTIISGEKFRQVFDLPSTWIYLEMKNDCLIIKARGYGHGVGMCQYGANGMAKAGKKYRQILQAYYKQIGFYEIDY